MPREQVGSGCASVCTACLRDFLHATENGASDAPGSSRDSTPRCPLPPQSATQHTSQRCAASTPRRQASCSHRTLLCIRPASPGVLHTQRADFTDRGHASQPSQGVTSTSFSNPRCTGKLRISFRLRFIPRAAHDWSATFALIAKHTAATEPTKTVINNSEVCQSRLLRLQAVVIQQSQYQLQRRLLLLVPLHALRNEQTA